MAVQLPSEVLGLGLGVLIYSLLSLSLGLLTAWLVWVHREGKSYIFLLTIFTTLGGLASIAQQLHTVIRWRDIKLEQHRHAEQNVGNPELALAGNSVGVDLALFYIQFTCYGIEALLIFFWSAVLFQSVYQLKAFAETLRYSNFIAKLCAVLLPAALICLLQVRAIQDSTIAFFVIANFCMSIGLVGGATMLLSILGRYLYTKHRLISFRFRYGKSSNRYGSQSGTAALTDIRPRRNIYDQWLILRLGIGFIALGIFQLVTIATEVTSQSKNNRSSLSETAQLTIHQARSDFVFFVPGATPPLVTFIVFGTTRPFREYMWNAFVPRCLRGRTDERTMKKPDDTQASFSQESHIYSGDEGFGHSVAINDRPTYMLANLDGRRREDDALPILAGSPQPCANRMEFGIPRAI